jgi:hypothetical protein
MLKFAELLLTSNFAATMAACIILSASPAFILYFFGGSISISFGQLIACNVCRVTMWPGLENVTERGH